MFLRNLTQINWTWMTGQPKDSCKNLLANQNDLKVCHHGLR